jgi:hypothetical protein
MGLLKLGEIRRTSARSLKRAGFEGQLSRTVFNFLERKKVCLIKSA